MGNMCVVARSIFFLFSSRRRHTRCALVTGVQTCALPIYGRGAPFSSAREKLFPVDADRDEGRLLAPAQDFEQHRAAARLLGVGDALGQRLGGRHRAAIDAEDHVAAAQALGTGVAVAADCGNDACLGALIDADVASDRSEEHPSEIQSLMSISYADFR